MSPRSVQLCGLRSSSESSFSLISLQTAWKQRLSGHEFVSRGHEGSMNQVDRCFLANIDLGFSVPKKRKLIQVDTSALMQWHDKGNFNMCDADWYIGLQEKC